ncbi:hypothetical protein BK004_00420 [bacterium CG10_46_32]|nr:MAG: hypothetical protein BK004_00420 [bacterium CG10_46_32]PIR56583.1 MAG: hypothetical protein COU73_00415 [Parcubacteria group bacterium CG10_big_fil_rev_8_21_14_0_10_46_32]
MDIKQQPKQTIEEQAINPRNMLHGFALAAIISGYILGPLLVLGGGAYWAYRMDAINKIVVVCAVITAFILSNILIITRSKKMIESFSKKTGIKDPTPAEAAKWREKNGPYDDPEEDAS